MFFSPAGSWEELLPLELIDRPNFHFLLENVLYESDGIDQVKSNNSEFMILSSAQNRAVEQFKDIIEEDSSLNLEVLVQKV